jgi:hypothetical protein
MSRENGSERPPHPRAGRSGGYQPRRRWPPVPIFAALLALVTIVLAVVGFVAVNTRGPAPVPTPQPTQQPSPEPIPEPVAIALSRPIPPGERPGDTQVIAVPSPGQVQAEGRKDWPDAAYSIWVECTDLLDRKQFDQAISRMNEVAARSNDRGVRAVAATCRAAAKVNNGDFAEAEPDLEQAKRDADSLPPEARQDVVITSALAEMPGTMNKYAMDSSGGSGSGAGASVGESAQKVQMLLYTLPPNSPARLDLENRLGISLGVGLSTCWARTNGSHACQEIALVAARALPGRLGTSVAAIITSFGQRSGPANPPNPPTTTTTGTTTSWITTPTTVENPTTATASTTAQATSMTQESSATTEQSTTTTTSKSTTTKTTKATTTKPATTKRTTTKSTTTRTRTPTTTKSKTTSNNGGGGG